MPVERWLVTGASGQLGGYVLRELARTFDVARILALTRQREVSTPGVAVEHVELEDAPALRRSVTAFRPTHVLHIGGMTAVADCHARPADAERINVNATRILAEASADLSARLVYTSTDMVFGGDAAPYRETDPPRPLSVYGRTKADAERVLRTFGHTLVVRVPLMYGLPMTPRATTFGQQLQALRAGEPLRLFTDEFRTPVWLGDAARALIGLARSDLVGLIHVAGPERLSRYDLIAGCARILGIARPNLTRISRLDVPTPEPRPADLSLDGTRLAERFPELVPGPLDARALSAISDLVS